MPLAPVRSHAANRPTRQARRLALTGLLAAAVLALAPAGASAATPYGTNLVKNPGAENGLTGWEVFPDQGAQSRTYGGAGLGYPSTADRNSIGGGSRFFTVNPKVLTPGWDCGDLQQTIKITGLNSSIDSGKVKVKLKGYAGTNGAGDINAHLDLYFRDANNHQVAVNGIEKTASSTNENYVRFLVTKTLPKNTRQLRVHLWGDGSSTEGGNCQVFFDKISVVLVRS